MESNLPSAFKPSLSYSADQVFLNVAFALTPAPGSRFSNNQQNVADALSGFFDRTGTIPLVFGTLTPAGLTLASGEAATGTQQTTFNAMNLFMGLLTDPFIAGRGGNAVGGAGATPFAEEGDSANAYAAKDKPRSERDAYAAISQGAAVRGRFVRAALERVGGRLWRIADHRRQCGAGIEYRDQRHRGDCRRRRLPFLAVHAGGLRDRRPRHQFLHRQWTGTGRSDLFQAGAFIRHDVGAAYLTGALAYGW
ncbi:hypothetical protein ACVWWG_003768 [Bradyrhizobium sp. LB7.2]